MSEIVNLNKARKARDRADRQRQAAENRVAFGVSKAVKDLAAARTDKARRELDSHRREDEPGD